MPGSSLGGSCLYAGVNWPMSHKGLLFCNDQLSGCTAHSVSWHGMEVD